MHFYLVSMNAFIFGSFLMRAFCRVFTLIIQYNHNIICLWVFRLYVSLFFSLPTSVLMSPFLSITYILTYAPISARCADVASCHSRSISLCASLPKGFALTHTCMYTQSHSHAHLCLPLPRGQVPPAATCSQSSLMSVPGWALSRPPGISPSAPLLVFLSATLSPRL